MENFEINKKVESLYPPLLDENLKVEREQKFDNFEKTEKNEQFFDKNGSKNAKNANLNLNFNNLMSMLQNGNNSDMLSSILALNKNPKISEVLSSLPKNGQKKSIQSPPTLEEF